MTGAVSVDEDLQTVGLKGWDGLILALVIEAA